MTWKLAIACVGLGFMGLVLAFILMHLYQDHLLVDAIRNDFQQRQLKQSESAKEIK